MSDPPDRRQEPPRAPPTIPVDQNRAEPTRLVNAKTLTPGGILPPLPAGEVVEGRWRITGILIEGTGQAVIYRATAITADVDEEVALKLYVEGHAPNTGVLERLQEHPHPGVLPVLDFGLFANRWYEVSPLVRGGTLADATPIEDRELLEEIVPHVLAALDHLHSLGVVHSDLKPENLFRSDAQDRAVLVGDLGAARLFVKDSDRSVFVATTVLATPGYSAPEASRRLLGSFSDFYSLGMTLLRLRGTRPEDLYGDLDELAIAVARDEFDPRSFIEEPIGELICGLVLTNPKHRWGSAQVRAWLADESVPIIRGTADNLRPLRWKGESFASKRDVARHLLLGSAGARELVFSGSLQEWLVQVNEDIEAWNQIRQPVKSYNPLPLSKSQRAAKEREILAGAAFSLALDLEITSPRGEELNGLDDLYRDLDRHLQDYLDEASTWRVLLEKFLLARYPDVARATAHLLAEALKDLSRVGERYQIDEDSVFLTILRFAIEPSTEFRLPDGERVRGRADFAEELNAIAAAIDAKLTTALARYQDLRVELYCLLHSRGADAHLRWFLKSERRWPEPDISLVALLHRWQPERGLREPGGPIVPAGRAFVKSVLTDPNRWADRGAGRAEVLAYLAVKHSELGLEVDKMCRQARLSTSALRTAALWSWRKEEPESLAWVELRCRMLRWWNFPRASAYSTSSAQFPAATTNPSPWSTKRRHLGDTAAGRRDLQTQRNSIPASKLDEDIEVRIRSGSSLARASNLLGVQPPSQEILEAEIEVEESIVLKIDDVDGSRAKVEAAVGAESRPDLQTVLEEVWPATRKALHELVGSWRRQRLIAATAVSSLGAFLGGLGFLCMSTLAHASGGWLLHRFTLANGLDTAMYFLPQIHPSITWAMAGAAIGLVCSIPRAVRRYRRPWIGALILCAPLIGLSSFRIALATAPEWLWERSGPLKPIRAAYIEGMLDVPSVLSTTDAPEAVPASDPPLSEAAPTQKPQTASKTHRHAEADAVRSQPDRETVESKVAPKAPPAIPKFTPRSGLKRPK